jgi:hypothetical protein
MTEGSKNRNLKKRQEKVSICVKFWNDFFQKKKLNVYLILNYYNLSWLSFGQIIKYLEGYNFIWQQKLLHKKKEGKKVKKIFFGGNRSQPMQKKKNPVIIANESKVGHVIEMEKLCFRFLWCLITFYSSLLWVFYCDYVTLSFN